MANRNEDSSAAGILIAVLIGGILLVGVAAFGYLFLGTTSVSSVGPASATITPSGPQEIITDPEPQPGPEAAAPLESE